MERRDELKSPEISLQSPPLSMNRSVRVSQTFAMVYGASRKFQHRGYGLFPQIPGKAGDVPQNFLHEFRSLSGPQRHLRMQTSH